MTRHTEWLEVTCYKLEPTPGNPNNCASDTPGYASAEIDVPHHPEAWLESAQPLSQGQQVTGRFRYHIPSASTKDYKIISLPGKTTSAGGILQGGALNPTDDSIFFNVATTPGADLLVVVGACGDEHQSVPVTVGGSCPIGGESQKPSSSSCPDCVAHPVSLANGNMRLSDTDPLPSASGVPLRRVYDSAGTAGFFGNGWSSLFDGWLRRYQDYAILGTETDERFIFENYLNQGTFIQIHPQTVTPSTLTYDGINYTLRSPSDDIVRVFRASDGRLISYQSRATGRTVTVTFASGLPTRLDDSWGRWGWTVNTNSQTSLIDSITVDGSSLVWQYFYGSGNLVNVNAPGASAWRSYTYTGNALTESRDAAGNLIESHTYNQSPFAHTLNPATNSLGPGGDVSSIQYDINGRNSAETITRVTTASGAVTDYYERSVLGRRRTVETRGSGCGACGSNDAVYGFEKQTVGAYSTYTGNITGSPA